MYTEFGGISAHRSGGAIRYRIVIQECCASGFESMNDHVD